MKINKTWVILGVALVVGTLAAIAANRYISNQLAEIDAREKNKRTVKVVVAKNDIVRGTRLGADNIAVRQIPADYAHSGAVLPEQFDRIENEAMAYNVKAGEAIMWSQLEGKKVPTFSNRVAAGRRAMSVSVDEISSISGMLEPGDSIDLMVTVDQKGKKVTFPIIQSVVVLAAGQRATAEAVTGEKRTYTTITLDTTPEEARRVIIAREGGKITALLRNPQDKTAMSTAKGDMAALFGGHDSDGSTIPVLYGGRGKLPEDIPPLGTKAVPPPLIDTMSAAATSGSGGSPNTPSAAAAAPTVITSTSVKPQ
jgi:pilus assembly protein CpaB